MRRWPLAAFVVLAVLTIGAFFFVQHLKVSTPLINGFPAPFPATIDPLHGGTCAAHTHFGIRPVSFRATKISFYLQNRADSVDVYVVDSGGERVARIGSNVRMTVAERHTFTWDGRLAGGAIAPDGRYYVQVSLREQGRTFLISDPRTGDDEPVVVDTAIPQPVVTAVTPPTIAGGSPRAVTIRYAGAGGARPQILIYRLGAGGAPRLVKRYAATSRAGASAWDGEIAGAPAPRGRYVIGLRVTDRACTTGSSPVTGAGAARALVTVG